MVQPNGTGWDRLEYVGQVGQGQGGLHIVWGRMGLGQGHPQIRWDRIGLGHFASLSFFLSLFLKTQPNHWAKRMVNTRLTTEDPRDCTRPEDKGPSSF